MNTHTKIMSSDRFAISFTPQNYTFFQDIYNIRLKNQQCKVNTIKNFPLENTYGIITFANAYRTAEAPAGG